MKNYLKRAKKWLLEEKYNNQKTPAYFKDILRIKKGEPLDYVIGFRKFLDCHIDLSCRPLIPREETEYWVEKAIKEIKNNFKNRKIKILDIFSGSGCIGIAILKFFPNSKVIFAEKYKRFIGQIKLNLKFNNIKKKRYKIIQSNVFTKIKGRFDFIFANPPYVALKKINLVQKSVLLYEPKKSIFAGEDGLKYIKNFLKDAPQFLKPKGIIYMEFDHYQRKKIEELLKKFGYKNYSFLKDQFKRFRYLKASVN